MTESNVNSGESGGSLLHTSEAPEQVSSSVFSFGGPMKDADAHRIASIIVNEATSNLPSDQLRRVAETLSKIADAVDQKWRPENIKSAYGRLSAAHRIERNSVNLALRAKTILKFRRDRAKSIPADVMGEPGWDILLELFCQFAGGAAASTKSLALISGVPQTTALRCLERLEVDGLIERHPSTTDRRVTLYELTKEGVIAVGTALEKCTVSR